MVAFRIPVAPSGLGDYGDAAPTSGAFAYDVGYPDAMGDARIFVGQDEAGGSITPDGLMLASTDPGDWPEASASLAYLRGDNASIGGVDGAVHRNGWSDGTRKYDRNIHQFTGRYIRFVRQNTQLRGGPVGRSNYAGKLASGVNEQFSPDLPSLEDIAKGFTGR